MANNRFEVVLSLKDADTVKRGLQSLGADGEKALKRLETATNLLAGYSTANEGVSSQAKDVDPVVEREPLRLSNDDHGKERDALRAELVALRDWVSETLGNLQAIAEHSDRIARRASEHLNSIKSKDED